MIPCTVYHTGLYERYDAVVINNKVYIDGMFSVSKATWWGETECPLGLCQFNVEGKWGFCDNRTGKIIIPPTWDYASPFYGGFSRVGIGCIVDEFRPNGGKYGFINKYGETVIPCIYEKADNCSFETAVLNNHKIINNYVIVYKIDKAGIIDMTGTVVSDFIFDEIYRTSSFWDGYIGINKKIHNDGISTFTLLDKCGNIIVENMTKYPRNYYYYTGINKGKTSGCSIIKRNRKFGVIHYSGKVIAEPFLLKRQALDILINEDLKNDFI